MEILRTLQLSPAPGRMSRVTQTPYLIMVVSRLRTVSLTKVVARELWFRSPRGNWQFFWILADLIGEIQRDGTIIEGAVH